MNVVVIHELCNLESNNLILKLIIAHKSDYVKIFTKNHPSKRFSLVLDEGLEPIKKPSKF